MKIGITRQFSWILVGWVTAALLQALNLTLVARWSGPQAFGLFSAVYGVALVIQVVADLGLTLHITRLRAADPESGGIGAALRLGRNVTIFTTITGCAAVVIFGIHNPAILILILMPVWLSSEKQVNAWLAIPLADGNTWQNATAYVLRRSGALAVLVIAHAIGANPIFGFLLGQAMFSLLAWAVACRMNKDVNYDRDITARELLASGRPYWLNSLGTHARNFDVVIVALLASPVSAGYYAIASRLTTQLRIVPDSLATVLLPAATRSKNGGKRKLLKPIAVMTAVTTVMYIVLTALMPVLVPLILGPSYVAACTTIQIVCMGMIFLALTSQLTALMQGWGYLRAVAVISTVTTTMCLGSIAILSGRYGAIGAAIALSSSFAIQLAIQIFTVMYFSRAGSKQNSVADQSTGSRAERRSRALR